MTNLPEVSDWGAGIYQIEQTDPVLGGPPNLETGAGIANVQAQQLAERTAWLKAQIAAAVATMIAAVIATGTGLTGGGALDAGLTLAADLADQAVAEAGSDNTKLMTALRTRQVVDIAINALVGAAPAQLDTLNELATAITDNGDTSAALTALTASKFGTADLADQDEVEAGTDNANLMTPLRVGQAVAALTPIPALSRYFESSQQTITSGGLLTLAHSMGGEPKLLTFELICITAEDGWSVGDILSVQMGGHTSSSVSRANVAYCPNASEVVIRFSSVTNCFTTCHKTSGAHAFLSNANWTLIMRAFA
ncbi:MAG: hypothetical protein HRU33_20750 [Rhodobacteraceae bacterium]|nr:hypothetical protein [Paracoccaceae bacterium]